MAKIQLILLLLGLCSVFCTKDDIYEYKGPVYLPGYDIKTIEREYREQERRVERPCPVYDLLCIRRYFARHSECKIAEGPVPNPLYRTESTTYLPTFNVTVTQNELTIGGLTGTVTAFSVNRRSKVTVLRINYKDVTVKSNQIYFRYHRRAQEPALTSSNLSDAIFPSLSITTVFKGVDHLSLADSESVVSIDILGKQLFSPELGKHPDPSIEKRYAKIIANPYIVQQETFLTHAPFFAATTIQNVICDFGLKLN